MSQQPDADFIEARTVAGLNHPNIVPVYATGERGGFVYLVMASVEGNTRGERIRTPGPQMGRAPVESVTATRNAASQIGADATDTPAGGVSATRG